MTGTLILNFHPDPARSRINAALADAAARLPEVEVRTMANDRQGATFDYAVEIERIVSAERLVLQFPVQWYSGPSLLADWMAQILTIAFYVRTQEDGARIEGRRLMIAAVAGNTPENYQPQGRVAIPLPELLRPFEAMARRCGLEWNEPFMVFRSSFLTDDELAREAGRYCERLEQFAERTLSFA
jgi:putative NADPH-quinone reductase